MTRLTGVKRIVATLLIGLLGLWGTSLAYADEPATITADGSLSEDYIIVSGNLSTAGGPVSGVEIFGEVQGEWYYVVTEGNGDFIMYLELPPGDAQSHQVYLLFEGNDDAAAAELELSIGSSGPDDSPPEEPVDVELLIVASLSVERARPGSLVEVSGTVTDTQGVAIVGSQVDAALNGQHQEDSTTLTGDSGEFVTYVQIPSDASAGGANIELSTPAVSGYASSSLSLPLTINEPLALPSDEDATEDQPADNEEEVAVDQDQAGGEEITTVPDESAQPGTPAYHAGPWDWFWAVVVIVGGTALFIVFTLIIRGLTRKRSGDETEAQLFGDDGLLARQFDAGDDAVGTDADSEPVGQPR